MALATHADETQGKLDRITLCLSFVLFVSPWTMTYSDLPVAATTACVSAFVIALASAAATYHLREWEEWVNLIAGAWLIVSPWLLGFNGRGDAKSCFVAIGMFTVAIAASEITGLHHMRRAGDRAKP